ncbi:penicillin-binding transpeptidase domain-containing protein [Paenibacillus thermotolerans]|uniref:penicillin-binding transpeptidase domain-containing protein n=1 Tax=Paenibacillus thermotolerans TaxID=3027807 RepID=UPI0023682897|nr:MULTISPECIES: penicillin-binding transpeptidase domain-containing protein [unclassified Paenibacillus]
MHKKIRVRSLVLGVVFTLFFMGIVARLYWLQVVEASALLAEAKKTWSTEKKLEADRGTIYDRKMNVLASDADGYTVIVDPQVIDKLGLAREVAAGLSAVLDKPEDQVYAQVTATNKEGKLLRNKEIRIEGWKIDKDLADQVLAWEKEFMKEHDILGADWPGVGLYPQKIRYYPKNSLASHILGYINKDGKPSMGLEFSLDELLRGKDGKIAYKKDEKGQKLPGEKPELVPPVNGNNVVLTIDQTIQHYTEQAMKKVYDEFKPKQMTAIAVDPKTMEVLALANLPTFNPNKYWEYDPEKDFNNMAIKSLYEPGSTFKLVTLTGAVDQGIFHPDETYQSGSIRVPGWTLRDHRRGGWGEISYLEGLLRSSNVAFVKLGYEQLKEEKFMEYINRFGFTSKTGIDLPGESQGRVQFRYPVEVATGTYGQGGVFVTPIQQLMAYAAIANGGKLMEPYVVKKVLDPETGKVISERQPKVIRQVVSEAKAKEISGYLEQVVTDDRGTGKRARLDEYRVAGKTGTANIVKNGEYAACDWVVSFIGYAPAEDPRIAVAVIIDSPNLGCDSNNAGLATTPVFKEIVSQSLRYMGVPTERKAGDTAEEGTNVQSVKTEAELITVPDVSDMETAAAVKELKARGLAAESLGSGPKVLGQYPSKGEQISEGSKVILLTADRDQAAIPDFTGQSLRDVVQVASLLGLRFEAEGEGYVVSQEVTEAQGEKVLKVVLKPLHEWPKDNGPPEEGDTGEGAKHGTDPPDDAESGGDGGEASPAQGDAAG